MRIRLNEIPQEGRSFEFDRANGKLDRSLEDLVGERPYDVKMFIKPIGSAYEMRGEVKTAVGEVCSKCGYDFELPIARKFHEILIEDQDEYRKTQGVHGNQAVDFLGEGPSMVAVKGEIFDAGDYAHELIALAEPFYPMCGANGECARSDEVRKIQEKLEAEFAAAEEAKSGHPAFAALKGLELGVSKKS